MTLEEAEIAKANAELKRLERILGEFTIAKEIVDVCGPAVLQRAFSRHEALKSELDEDELNPTLAKAFANTRQDRGREPIKLFANPSKVGMHTADQDKPKDGTKAFATAADRVSKIASSMSEDHLDDHRSVNNGELGWVKRKPSADQISTVKKAALKSAAQRNENYFAVNETAMQILKVHSERKLQETTAAARTIVAHPLTGESSVKAALPKEFSDSHLADVKVQRNVADANGVSIRMPNWDVKSSLPAEFAPKIEKSVDRSFGAAAKSIQRPSGIDFKDQEKDQQLPQVPRIEPEIGDGESMAADSFKVHPNSEPQWSVSLKSPKSPKQGFDPVNGAI